MRLESDISSWSFWDEVETPVGGDVVDLDASACNLPIYIYATECGHGSMFSKERWKEVLDESEMPSVLDNAPNIWMESTLNTSNSEDTYACVDENCDEEKLISEFPAACEDDCCIIEDACMQSNALELQTTDVNHGNKKEACKCSIDNKQSVNCFDNMSYAYLACSADEQNAEEDLNLDTDWGFEEPKAEIDLCMEPYVTKARARLVVLKAERQEEKKQAVVKQFVLETACKVVGFVLFVYFGQKIRDVYADNAQDMVVRRNASDNELFIDYNLRSIKDDDYERLVNETPILTLARHATLTTSEKSSFGSFLPSSIIGVKIDSCEARLRSLMDVE
ncbi:hypothetical protein L7F22_050453 [Adiantum nelumboides]|nr:hypothetical protein [Adiantum nelumboides]